MPTMTQTPPNILAATWDSAYVKNLPDSSFAFVADDVRKLPYKDASGKVDLPHVRNALARLSKTAGIPDDQKAGIKAKLQGALKTNVKAADDVQLTTIHAIQAADADSTTELPTRMMLLRSGIFNTQKYGEIPLEASDLYEMAANFKAGIGMASDGSTGLPVDYGHKSGENAGAWIKAMEVLPAADDPEHAELWASELEWTGSGRKAIADREYKMLSADFYPKSFGEWVDPESGVAAQNVVVGAGLTNRPMFSGNQPVTASEVDSNTDDAGGTRTIIYVNASEKNKENTMDLSALRVKAAEDVSGGEQRFLQAHVAELSAAEQTKFELVKPVEASTEEDKKPKQIKASEVTGSEGEVVVQASELKEIVDKNKTLDDKVSRLEASSVNAEKERLGKEVEKHIARGALKADRKDSWVGRLVAADEDGRKEILADLSAMQANPVLAKEQGSGDDDETVGSDPRTELMNKAVEKVQASTAEGKTLSIEAALDQVKAAEPELAQRAVGQRREQLKVEASADQFEAAGVNRG